MGIGEYPPLAERFGVPIVVTGFEPLDILEGIRRTVHQLEDGRHEVENAYPRAVAGRGQPGGAARCSRTSSRSTDRAWRGIGMIPQSGWRLSEQYREFDAEHRFAVGDIHTEESTVCRSGEVLQGLIKPHECAAFGTQCTPRNPLGATMVSSEGACAAYYLYRRLQIPAAGRRPTRAAREVTPLAEQLDPDAAEAPELRGLDLPAAAARQPDRRDGPRRRRRDVGRAGRAPLPARRSATPALEQLGDSAVLDARAAAGWPSRPTRSWSGRCSSPAAASATWRSTARSTTWR